MRLGEYTIVYVLYTLGVCPPFCAQRNLIRGHTHRSPLFWGEEGEKVGLRAVFFVHKFPLLREQPPPSQEALLTAKGEKVQDERCYIQYRAAIEKGPRICWQKRDLLQTLRTPCTRGRRGPEEEESGNKALAWLLWRRPGENYFSLSLSSYTALI